ncbi:hypothetical protein ACDA63_17960 [Uliginosibacterium sp. sgz301328]|uniref:hypothetical protein n=1 Tax=Uliginosibacterium sp. sgz301328 TaxID=3243764 RepID=UPI00359E9FDE
MKRILIPALLTLAVGAAFAQQSQLAADPWKAQRERAEKMRQEAELARRQAQEERDVNDAACYHKFLVNYCLDKSRETYLERIVGARKLEIEAANLEREAKSAELAIKDAERAANPPQPTVGPLGDVSAPHAGPRPTMPPIPANRPAPEAPKPTAAPLDPKAQAEHDAARQAQRAQEAEEAAKRAQQAREDKARYDERAREAAEKKAAKGQSAPAAK